MPNLHKARSTLLILITIVAAALRLINLSANPPAAYGDEISFAWNAWNILKTGADEYGTPYPLQFKAFNDYKAPVPVYLLVPIFRLFGMNTASLRVPVAIAGTLTVWATYLLVKEAFIRLGRKSSPRGENQATLIAILSALLLAVSPWHIHLSRGYFEATLALLPFVLGIYFVLKGLGRPLFFPVAALLFAVSLYTYFTPRLILLLFLPFLFVVVRPFRRDQLKPVLLATVIFLILALPLVKLTLFDQGSHRLMWLVNVRYSQAIDEATRELSTAGGPIIFRKFLHNRFVVLARNITDTYLENLSLNFWYIYGDSSLRYFLGKMGMFYLVELPFFVAGLYLLSAKQGKLAGFFLGLLLIAPLPSALVDRPFAVRSLMLLPAPFIFVSYGIVSTLEYLRERSVVLKRYATLFIGLLFAVSLSIYLLRYHLDYIRYAATWWGWENKAAIEYALAREDDYDMIFISNFYTGAELAYAFYTSYDPLAYRQAKQKSVILADNRQFMRLGKFYFGSLDIDEDRSKMGLIPKRSLYIGRPEEADGEATISSPDDGRVLFKIHTTR